MPDENLTPFPGREQLLETYDRIENNQCEHCGEPLRATDTASGSRSRSFAINPHGFAGPLLFCVEHGGCGPLERDQTNLSVGMNLSLSNGRIAADIGGCMSAQEADVFLANLYLLLSGAGFPLTWFRRLMSYDQEDSPNLKGGSDVCC